MIFTQTANYLQLHIDNTALLIKHKHDTQKYLGILRISF